METKHDKFLRLKESRLERVVYHLGLLGNLASVNYEFTSFDAQELSQKLRSQLDKLEIVFGVAPATPRQAVSQEDVLWALDKLAGGRPAEALEFLVRAIKRSSDPDPSP